jgi:hypothetical protein
MVGVLPDLLPVAKILLYHVHRLLIHTGMPPGFFCCWSTFLGP